MTKKIFNSILAVASLSVIICTLFMSILVYNSFSTHILKTLKSDAVLVRRGVEEYGASYLDKISGDNRLTWISAEGEVLFDTFGDAEDMENHGEREEIIEAREKGIGTSTRYSVTLGRHSFYYAVSLSDGSVIRVGEDSNSFMPLLSRIIYIMLFIIVLVVVISVPIARVLAKKVVRPINEMDIERLTSEGVYKEIAPLIHRINRQNNLISAQMTDLKRRQEEFRAITENMGEGLIVVDEGAEILSYNKSALKMLRAEGVVYGASIFEVSRNDAFADAVKKALSGDKTQTVFSHGERYFRVFASPVEREKCGGAVIVLLDVTEVEQREALRREFTSNVSHELKTPLTSIYGISEIMAGGIVKPEDMKGFAKNINDESGRLIRLINDIIKLSQLDEGTAPLEKERIDLMAVAKEVRSRLRLIYEKAGIDFVIEGESVFVTGVSGIISEMVYNLCDNAIKYNKEGGSVTVFVGYKEGRPCICVTDTGIGIAESDIGRVFERFYRVDKSHSKEKGGTGLGLSIVKHAAAYHNATLHLESKLGEGTCAWVIF